MSPAADVLVIRPFRMRYVAIAFAIGLTAFYVVGFFALPVDYTAEVTLSQLLTLLALLVFFVGLLVALAACTVRADVDGLTIRNGLRTHRVPWFRVHQILLRPGDPWASVLLRTESGEFHVDLDAEKRQLMAIQGHDGQRAREAVAQLQRRLADWRATRSRGT